MVKLIDYNPDMLIEDFLRLKYTGAYTEGQFKDYLIANGFRHLPKCYFSIKFKKDNDNNLIEIDTDLYSDYRHSYYDERDFNYQNKEGMWLYACLVKFLETKGYSFEPKIIDQDKIKQFVKTLQKEGFKNFDRYFRVE